MRSVLSNILRRLRATFAVESGSPALMKAQVEVLSRQAPLMYLILIVNSAALAITHLGAAPPTLTIGFPSALCMVAVARMAMWWRAHSRPADHGASLRVLRGTIWAAALLGVGFTAWALALYPYGDDFAHAHVAFYMAITLIGIVFCMMHHRTAALVLTAIVLTSMTVFFLRSGNPVFIAIAVNSVLVGAAMIVVLLTNYRDFAALVDSRQDLLARQAETERLSDENFRLANLDGLTGLPNRRWFFARMEAALEQARAEERRFAVGLLDLDGFKPVNDAYGHAVGDRLLIEAGNRLNALGEPGLLVARLGGDEYGLIVDRDIDAAALTVLGAQICDILRAPYLLQGVSAQAGGSLGFAIWPDAADDATRMFEHADYALYHAKQSLRGAAVVFSEVHEHQIREDSIIEQTLRGADLDQEMTLAFQPIIDVDAGRTVAFEALARWHSPTLGSVSPGVFIPLAERSGLICDITVKLLAKALEAARDWPQDVRVSFNLSTRDIAAPDQIAAIIAIVEASGVDPRRVDFEITETALMRDFDQAHAALTALKALGARIALDDFGVGHSSLSYVGRLPLDKIKIDRGFIVGIELNPTSRSIVKTILDLCRNLGLDCVVEGAETQEQVNVLRLLGCRVMQGYLLARPMPGEAVAGHLTVEKAVSRDTGEATVTDRAQRAS